MTIPLLFQEGTSLWPLWIFAEGTTSVALARNATSAEAHLAWDRYGSNIVLDTSDPAAWKWHKLGLAMLRPGWLGFAAAVLQTASAGFVSARR